MSRIDSWSTCSLFVFLIWLQQGCALVSLKTHSFIPNQTAKKVHDFLATPSNWPNIVLSSVDVKGSAVSQPLAKGDEVEEVFGLPPLLPLSVKWICERSDDAESSVLDVRSPEGVTGLASNCRMLFYIQEADTGTNVDLTIEYEPENILARLAIPVLTIDNALALKVFLPKAMKQPQSPLDDFLKLMGTLYGTAGIAHLVDCLMDSKLLIAAGAPPFYDLSPAGKALALLWCAVGPLSFWASNAGLGTLGLVGYGAVELICAALAGATSTVGTDMDPLINAILVQAIVAVSWLYSWRNESNPQQQQR